MYIDNEKHEAQVFIPGANEERRLNIQNNCLSLCYVSHMRIKQELSLLLQMIMRKRGRRSSAFGLTRKTLIQDNFLRFLEKNMYVDDGEWLVVDSAFADLRVGF